MILGAYQGDEDQYAMNIGADSSGNAYGIGSVASSKAESSDSDAFGDDRGDNAFYIRNGSLAIQWNIGALNSRIETHEQFDHNIRAGQLNREIAARAMEGIFNHSVPDSFTEKPYIAKILSTLADGHFIYTIADNSVKEDFINLSGILGSRVVVVQLIARHIAFYKPDKNQGDAIPDLLFYSIRPTRAAIGAGILASSKMVRPTPTKNI